MTRRKRKDRCRMWNLLDSRTDIHNFDGFTFMFQPSQDPVAWMALQYYASITPNVAQRRAIEAWLAEHPDPGMEQMEMAL